MRFSRQEYWSGLPCSPPGDLPNPGIKPTSLTSPALAGGFFTTAAAAKSPQSCPTLCDLIDGSPPGSPCPWDSPGKNIGVSCHFLLQCMKVKGESEVAQSCSIFATPWTAGYQAPPSMGFSRQEYSCGVPLPSLHAHPYQKSIIDSFISLSL